MASFDAHTSNDRGSTTSYYSLESVGAAYLFNTVVGRARERQGIRPSVVCIVNDTTI